jgi:metal-responsive CopG/Arc/MetJ family transcriptional regulator
MGNDDNSRAERLQVMLTQGELSALDDFRFKRRMPSRAAAIRELLRRGLAADGFNVAVDGSQSAQFGVMADSSGSGDGAADN